MSQADVIKEYLVRLGFKVDDSSYKKATEATGLFEKMLGKHLSTTSMIAVKAATQYIGAMAAVAASVIKTVDEVAKADMRYQLLAQRMYMSVQATKAFTIATETMGHNLQEIAWNAELKERYFELVDLINGLETPPEAKAMFKQVRDIRGEFNKLKVEASYAIEWLAFHLLKLNKGALVDTKLGVSGLVDYTAKNLRSWTEQLARFIQVPIELIGSLAKAFRDAWSVISPALKKIVGGIGWVIDSMTPWHKELIVLAGLLIAVFAPVTGPILTAIAAVTALTLIVSDFYAYLEGKESSDLLKPFWEFVEFLNYNFKKALLATMAGVNYLWEVLTKKRKFKWVEFKSVGTPLAKEVDMEHEKMLEERAKKRAANQAARRALKGGATLPSAPSVAVTSSVEKSGKFKEDMYKALYQEAVKAGVKNPEVVAKLGVTQASLETGYGKHVPNYNYFGIKGKGSVQSTQEFINGKMVTKKESFAVYKSMEESAAAYVQFLQKNKRYKDVLEAKTVEQAISAQARTGYATNKDYGKLLASIAKRHGYVAAPGMSLYPSESLRKAGSVASEEVVNNVSVTINTESKDPNTHARLVANKTVEELKRMRAAAILKHKVAGAS